jgi:hypothetical protein
VPQAAPPAVGSGISFLQVDREPFRVNEADGSVMVGNSDGHGVHACTGVDESNRASGDRKSWIGVVVNAHDVVERRAFQ